MKAIMLSVRLWWFYLTYKGIKTIEVRKRFPKNFKGIVFEYVSKTNWQKDLMKIPENEREFFKQFVNKVGLKFYYKVEGIAVLNNTYRCYMGNGGFSKLCKDSCLSYEELDKYLGTKSGYAIHISNLVIFDKPKELSEFYKVGAKEEYEHIMSIDE